MHFLVFIALFLAIPTAYSQTCASNQYLNQTCLDCEQKCSTCTNSSYCNECNQMAYLLANRCVSCSARFCMSCPNDSCKQCIESYYLQKNQCLPRNDYTLILMSIGVAMFGVLFLLCCCCWIGKMCRRTSHAATIVNINVNQSFNNINSEVLIKIDQGWKLHQIPNESRYELCSICLQTNPSLSLSCHHPFHVECIRLWLRRNADCPLCKRGAVGVGRVCCVVCWRYVRELRVQQLRYVEIGGVVCDGCSNVGLNRQSGLNCPGGNIQQAYKQNEIVQNVVVQN